MVARSRGFNPWRVVSIIASIVLVCSLAALGVIGFSYWQGQDQYSRLRDTANLHVYDGQDLAKMTVDWDALREINPDVIGWVVMPGTAIDYPIVQTVDNQYYLKHGFNKEENWLAVYGTIFLECTNANTFTDDNSVLYGHHMRDGSMFALIDELTSQEKFDENRTTYILTPQGNLRLKSFSLVVTNGSDQIVQTTFGDRQAKTDYIQDKIDRNSVANVGVKAEDIAKTNTVAMSTCDYSVGDGRALLFSYVADSTIAGVTGLEQIKVSDKIA